MVKKIVGDILEEEYDDMYYSMRTKEDLDLYKKANWQRAVNLVLGMLMGKGEEAQGRDKVGREEGREGRKEERKRETVTRKR
eukprot:evm.model.NODE_30661_length_25231_cov_31.101463.4